MSRSTWQPPNARVRKRVDGQRPGPPLHREVQSAGESGLESSGVRDAHDLEQYQRGRLEHQTCLLECFASRRLFQCLTHFNKTRRRGP
jgi:hypothetical protein